jgi:hypothetical protein
MNTPPAVTVGLIFGTEYAHAYDRHGMSVRNVESVHVFDFANKAESEAFLKGVDDASGWLDYDSADDQQLVAMGLNPELTVVAVFGKDASIDDELGDEDDEGGEHTEINGDDKPEPVTFTFDTAAERKAFQKGLEEGIGWMEYSQLSEESLAAYQQASVKLGGETPVIHGFRIDLKNGEQLTVATYMDAQEVDAVLVNAKVYIETMRSYDVDGFDNLDHRPCDDLEPGLEQCILDTVQAR